MKMCINPIAIGFNLSQNSMLFCHELHGLNFVIGDFMTTQLSIIFLTILTACNSKSGDRTVAKHIDGMTSKSNIQLQVTTTIHQDTITINNKYYIQTSKDDRFNCLLSMQGDTIIKSEDYYFEAKFLDIDEDGYKDIRVFAFSNTPNQCDNYLFDKTLKTFRLVENCDLDIQKIKGTDFYYSYNRAGCADMNWESYLSKVENYKLVDYGYIYGQGCDFEVKDNPQVIEIYKIDNVLYIGIYLFYRKYLFNSMKAQSGILFLCINLSHSFK